MPQVKKIELTQPYTTLPRGGYVAETSAGYIQFGSPPETIKDTMFLPRSTPLIFVLPQKTFHVRKGISVAELEFPLYYNHFLRQKKTYVVCTREQREQLQVVLAESVFGPEIVDLRSEYADGEDSFGFPNMQAEIDYFRGGRTLDDLVHFVIFNAQNEVRINNVALTRGMDTFVVEDHDWSKRTEIPADIGYNIIFDRGGSLPEPYRPPTMGITCLGPSHGFDPEENTSGFLLWINHKGIMIDPPVNSTEWLRDANVNPKLINSILLTHCHADHDAGTFQKILEEGKITIYSSETVIHSFIRKYHALTGIPSKELFTLFDFVPVIVGNTCIINGAEFRFSYALHSIPSLSFEFAFQDQTFLYSSDHLNDPVRYEELLAKGVLTESRYRDLLDFPWHHNVIYHEAGVPPLHTRIDYLNSLPREIQEKVHVYHIAKKDMPKETHLRLCKFGIEHTFEVKISPPRLEEAYRLLECLSNLDIFRDFPIARAKEWIAIVQEEHFKRDDVIIRKNTPGDKFYVILSGNVKVEWKAGDADSDGMAMKRYATYEYFGEASLINDTLRNADVVAETDCVLLTIDKARFLNFIKGSDLQRRLTMLNKVRETGTWDVISASRFFKGITSDQKTQLELIMEPRKFGRDLPLIAQGKQFSEAYIVKTGVVEVMKDGRVIETLTRGDVCGEIYNLQREAPSSFEFRAETDVDAYALDRERLTQYIANNPGVYMRLNYVFGNQ